MGKSLQQPARAPASGGLTRRQVIAGAAIAALAAGAPTALASRTKGQRRGVQRRSDATLRRYMAAASVLLDGRILVTGGYDRPADGKIPLRALSGAVIYDPSRDQWFEAAPMQMGRARHASVTLPDGRVAVLGGVAAAPTASVEIYDPQTNTWTLGVALSQARFDHAAAVQGGHVYLLGGSSSAMLGSIEVYEPREMSRTRID